MRGETRVPARVDSGRPSRCFHTTASTGQGPIHSTRGRRARLPSLGESGTIGPIHRGGPAMARAAANPTITPIHRSLGARVAGVDLDGPVSDDLASPEIFDVFREFAVLVVSDQRLADLQQRAFKPVPAMASRLSGRAVPPCG